MGGEGKKNELKGESLGMIDIPIHNGEEKTPFPNLTNLGNNQETLAMGKKGRKWKRMEGKK